MKKNVEATNMALVDPKSWLSKALSIPQSDEERERTLNILEMDLKVSQVKSISALNSNLDSFRDLSKKSFDKIKDTKAALDTFQFTISKIEQDQKDLIKSIPIKNLLLIKQIMENNELNIRLKGCSETIADIEHFEERISAIENLMLKGKIEDLIENVKALHSRFSIMERNERFDSQRKSYEFIKEKLISYLMPIFEKNINVENSNLFTSSFQILTIISDLKEIFLILLEKDLQLFKKYILKSDSSKVEIEVEVLKDESSQRKIEQIFETISKFSIERKKFYSKNLNADHCQQYNVLLLKTLISDCLKNISSILFSCKIPLQINLIKIIEILIINLMTENQIEQLPNSEFFEIILLIIKDIYKKYQENCSVILKQFELIANDSKSEFKAESLILNLNSKFSLIREIIISYTSICGFYEAKSFLTFLETQFEIFVEKFEKEISNNFDYYYKAYFNIRRDNSLINNKVGNKDPKQIEKEIKNFQNAISIFEIIILLKSQISSISQLVKDIFQREKCKSYIKYSEPLIEYLKINSVNLFSPFDDFNIDSYFSKINIMNLINMTSDYIYSSFTNLISPHISTYDKLPIWSSLKLKDPELPSLLESPTESIRMSIDIYMSIIQKIESIKINIPIEILQSELCKIEFQDSKIDNINDFDISSFWMDKLGILLMELIYFKLGQMNGISDHGCAQIVTDIYHFLSIMQTFTQNDNITLKLHSIIYGLMTPKDFFSFDLKKIENILKSDKDEFEMKSKVKKIDINKLSPEIVKGIISKRNIN